MSPPDPGLYLNGMPLDYFERLRCDSPRLRVELDNPTQIDSAWVLTRYEAVLAVLRDDETFSSSSGITINKFSMSSPSGGGKPTVITMDRADHRRVRPILGATFTPRTVRLFAESYSAVATDIVAAAVARGTFDAVADVAVELPLQAICQLLGIPEELTSDVKRWGDALATPFDVDSAPSPECLGDSTEKLWGLAAELATARLEDPRDDVISRLAPQIGTPALSMDEYLGMISLLAVAGNETMRNNISHSLHA